jgi:hypothetical protein
MSKKERDGEGVDVVSKTQTDDVAYGQDGWVPGCNVSCSHWVINHQMEHNVNL